MVKTVKRIVEPIKVGIQLFFFGILAIFMLVFGFIVMIIDDIMKDIEKTTSK